MKQMCANSCCSREEQITLTSQRRRVIFNSPAFFIYGGLGYQVSDDGGNMCYLPTKSTNDTLAGLKETL